MPAWFRVLLVASVAITTYGLGHLGETACQSRQTVTTSDTVAPLAHELNDTLWLDKYPEMMHDKWNGYIFSSDNVGLNIQAESAFKLTLEVFEFQIKKNNLRWHFPHDGKKADTKYTIERLKKPTKHFDRQLTIENDPKNGGATKVYFTGPEFGSAETIESLAPGALNRLKGHLPAGNE